MLIKIGLSLGIISLTYILGSRKARDYEKREHILIESVILFKRMKNEIKFMLATLPNALEIARQGLKTEIKDTVGALVVKLLEAKNLNFELDASMEMDKLNCLTPYDKQVISSGISRLGSSDVEAEENLIDNTINIIETQIEDAKYQKQKNYKLYKTLGVAAGMIIVVILI